MRIDSKLIHAGVDLDASGGAGVAPIARSTIYKEGPPGGYHEILYPRLSTLPGQRQVAETIAAIEGAEAALVTASGMAAIATALLEVLGKEGHLLAHRALYGGTMQLCAVDLPQQGHSISIIDATNGADWEAALSERTRAIYVEAMTNPTLEIADHKAVVAFAKAHGLISIVDSTFATPVNFRPLQLGYDLVVHSATKYLNGHSDVVAGAIAGGAELVGRIKRRLDHLGGAIDPHAAYLLQRGLKTLALRVRRQNDSALQIARALSGNRRLARVVYPGLADHPQHARAAELFSGFGGMLAIDVRGGRGAAELFTRSVQLALHSVSLGGVETLVTIPAAGSHAGVRAQEREALGITDGLVRISIGIEEPEDILADLEQALSGSGS